MPDTVHIDHVSCGSAHTICWSSVRRKLVCPLPEKIPMEFNHIQTIPIPVLRNRLILLHHFSNLFCKSLSLFSLQSRLSDLSGACGVIGGEMTFADSFDRLRGVLVSSAKVHIFITKGRTEKTVFFLDTINHGKPTLCSVYLGICIPESGEGYNDTGQTARPCHRAEQDSNEEVAGSRETCRPRRTQLCVWSDVLQVDHHEPGRPAATSQSVEGESRHFPLRVKECFCQEY